MCQSVYTFRCPIELFFDKLTHNHLKQCHKNLLMQLQRFLRTGLGPRLGFFTNFIFLVFDSVFFFFYSKELKGNVLRRKRFFKTRDKIPTNATKNFSRVLNPSTTLNDLCLSTYRQVTQHILIYTNHLLFIFIFFFVLCICFQSTQLSLVCATEQKTQRLSKNQIR